MTSGPEQTRMQLWRYPGKWSKEESFWREMTTRTLSALLAAGVIVLAVRSVGLFSQIQWTTIGKAFLAGSAWVGAAGTLVGFVFAALAARATRRAERLRGQMRDASQQVGSILNRMEAHEEKRRQWESDLAELERTNSAEVEAARRAYQLRHGTTTDGSTPGHERGQECPDDGTGGEPK